MRAAHEPLADIVAAIEAAAPRRVWIVGGSVLLNGLAALGRVHMLELALVPLVLGEGIPLFPDGMPGLGLRLLRSEAKPGGALHLVYERREGAAAI